MSTVKNDVVILSGGLGTRLSSVVQDTQKTMATVKGKPFLEHLIDHYVNFGFSRFIICSGYRHGDIEKYFGDGTRWGVAIKYSFEPERSGTAGAIKLAEKLINSDDYFVLNGDTYLGIDPIKVLDFHKRNNADGTICLRKFEDISEKGEVIIDNKNKIIRFLEKQPVHRTGLINAGVYIFNKKILSLIPQNKEVSIEQDVFPKAIRDFNFVGYKTSAFFIDIGTSEEYFRSQKELPAKE